MNYELKALPQLPRDIVNIISGYACSTEWKQKMTSILDEIPGRRCSICRRQYNSIESWWQGDAELALMHDECMPADWVRALNGDGERYIQAADGGMWWPYEEMDPRERRRDDRMEHENFLRSHLRGFRSRERILGLERTLAIHNRLAAELAVLKARPANPISEQLYHVSDSEDDEEDFANEEVPDIV